MSASVTSCHIVAVFFLFTRLVRANSSVKEMEKISLSSSCWNLISSNSCLALYYHEVRESPISDQSQWADISCKLCS